MMPLALKKERRYLILSVLGNVLVGCVGLAIAAVSDSQAILLDGLFNLTYFATGLFTLRVAALVAGGDNDRFPHGYAFFEPLVNGIKGLLVLGVSIMALAGALQSLFTGGRAIAAGTAVGYGVFASVACSLLALAMRHGARATGSPLVRTDADNWVVNAAISSCVMLAFIGILVLRSFELDRFTPYVDPVAVLSVVLITLGVPVRMAWGALMELLNRAPDREIIGQITRIVDSALSPLPVQERFIRVIQPGRLRIVLVHVVLPADFQPHGLAALDAIREATHRALSDAHAATVVDVLFTTDRRWGAPLSDGGAGPHSQHLQTSTEDAGEGLKPGSGR